MYEALTNLNLTLPLVNKTEKATASIGKKLIDENGEISVTIKEMQNSKSDKNNKDGKKIKKKFRINKIKMAAIILALILAIPASQLILNLFTGAFSEQDVIVPNIIGMTIEEGTQTLDDLKLKIKVGDELYSSDYEAGIIMSQSPSNEMTVKTGNTIVVNTSKGQREGTVPILTNKSLVDAIFTLENYGFVQGDVTIEASDLPKDFVIRQSPEAGTPSDAGTRINLVVSDGLKTQKVSMPNLVGMNIEDAKLELTKVGLLLGEIAYEYSPMYDQNIQSAV
jgi:serine/threonine-protein kinase